MLHHLSGDGGGVWQVFKAEHRFTTKPIIPPSRNIPKRKGNIRPHKDLCTNTAAFVHHGQSGTLQDPSASEWINGIWNRHTTEYYSATKRNDR